MFHNKRILKEQTDFQNYIMDIQRKLKEIYPGLYLGKTGPNKDGVDGILGDRTRKALLKFQLDNGAGPNAKGFPGKWTASKLGIPYVAKSGSDVVSSDKNVDNKKDNVKDKDNKKTDGGTTSQSCSKFEIYPSLSDTLPKICKGQTNNIQKGPSGCSEYVRQKTGKWQGNAWHAYKTKGYPSLSGFKSFFSNPSNLEKAAKAFQKINSSASSMKNIGSSANSEVASMMQSTIPSQSSFKNLGVGDVVGLFYPPSSHHSEAFYQAATGLGSDGAQITAGPYFVVEEGGKTRPWNTGDIGKNVKIKPGNSLKKGEHFGFNTHLGFVGAKKPNGEPIIYHNVNGNVLATPLSDMGGKFSIVWGRPA